MGKLLSSLQLQTFLILWIIYIVNGAPYSKYGRTCKDIGCLPRETCVMAYDTCSFNQQEGTNCGRYPTCQKRTDMQTPQQNTNTGPILLNPSPDNTRNMKPDYVAPRDPINPNNVFGWPSNPNIYPQMPAPQIPLDIPRLPDNRQPFPAMPNPNGGLVFNNPPYHPDLTPPPNIGFDRGFDMRYPRTTANPKFLDQFFNSKQQRNSSTINNANLNLSLISLLFLLIYRLSNNFA